MVEPFLYIILVLVINSLILLNLPIQNLMIILLNIKGVLYTVICLLENKINYLKVISI